MGLLDDAISRRNLDREATEAREAANLAWNLKFSMHALLDVSPAKAYRLDPTNELRSATLLSIGEQDVIRELRARLDLVAASQGFIIPTPNGTEVFKDRLDISALAASGRIGEMARIDPDELQRIVSLVNSNLAAVGRAALRIHLFHQHSHYTSYSISLVFDETNSFYETKTAIGVGSQSAQLLAAAAAPLFG